jgi:hypothetical protein
MSSPTNVTAFQLTQTNTITSFSTNSSTSQGLPEERFLNYVADGFAQRLGRAIRRRGGNSVGDIRGDSTLLSNTGLSSSPVDDSNQDGLPTGVDLGLSETEDDHVDAATQMQVMGRSDSTPFISLLDKLEVFTQIAVNANPV